VGVCGGQRSRGVRRVAVHHRDHGGRLAGVARRAVGVEGLAQWCQLVGPHQPPRVLVPADQRHLRDDAPHPTVQRRDHQDVAPAVARPPDADPRRVDVLPCRGPGDGGAVVPDLLPGVDLPPAARRRSLPGCGCRTPARGTPPPRTPPRSRRGTSPWSHSSSRSCVEQASQRGRSSPPAHRRPKHVQVVRSGREPGRPRRRPEGANRTTAAAGPDWSDGARRGPSTPGGRLLPTTDSAHRSGPCRCSRSCSPRQLDAAGALRRTRNATAPVSEPSCA
jgi:hypothetical protein